MYPIKKKQQKKNRRLNRLSQMAMTKTESCKKKKKDCDGVKHHCWNDLGFHESGKKYKFAKQFKRRILKFVRIMGRFTAT